MEFGFKLLVIEVTGNLKKAREVIKDNKATFTLLLDSELYSRKVLNVMGTPTTFIVDKEGRIRCRLIGADDLEKVVEDVLVRI